ncbi:hypothetical protein AAVH_12865 [Aphelenchoides avenae]|nr:hypothetical protein AAVH_12865 [Aphelenchus avenae]
MCIGKELAEVLEGIVGAQCVAPILVNGMEAKALFDLGSQVNIISRDFLRHVMRNCRKSLGKLPAIVGHPSGVNIKDASGKPMPFAGAGHCEIQIDASDSAEVHKFLIQDGANFEVILGTPALIGSRKWCERTRELLKT